MASVLLVVTGGCADLVDTGPEGGIDTANPPGEDPVEDCLSQTFQANENESAPRSAWIECHANVPGSNEQAMRCGAPAEAELRVSTNLTAGHVTVTVRDGEDDVVVERRFADTGGEVRNVTMQPSGAAAGEWTLAGQRDEAFDGRYRAELYCPSG